MSRRVVDLTVSVALTAWTHCALAQPTIDFGTRTSSGAWIDITLSPNVPIFVPIKVNGHDAMGLLNPGEPSTIDKSLADRLGLAANAGAAELLGGVTIEVDGISVRDISAKPDDMFVMPVADLDKPAAFLRGEEFFRPFLVGDEVFAQMAVDIDFAHHRIAFRDPRVVTKPSGAVELPLRESDGVRAIPVSINGAAPAPFALHVSNVIGPMMATPSFAATHQLLEGHPTSQRLSQPYSETVVTMERVRLAGVDFEHVPLAIIPDTALPPASINGDVGLPLLVKFKRVIIDYPHDRVFMVPDDAAAKTPVQRDRIGMILGRRKSGGFGVAFVSPNSPAEAAGFKKGDAIRLIDGKPYEDWAPRDIAKFAVPEAGTSHSFVMEDGTERKVVAKDFF